MNNWIDKLERKYGRYGISNLMGYITATMLAVYAFTLLTGSYGLINLISLSANKVLHGQIWRLVTFIVQPQTSGFLTFLLALYFYYSIGSSLEYHWGTFRFNLYYLFGMIGAIIAAFIAGYGSNTYLNLSLFLAFAAMFPEQEVLLFYIIPIKVKYLAYLDWGLYALTLLFGNSVTRMAALFSLLNYFLFFGPDTLRRAKNQAQYRKVQQNFRRQTQQSWDDPWKR